MPSLIIKRKADFANRGSSFQLFLDGEFIGGIKDHETKHFEIASGSYSLQAKIDWCGSHKLDFQVADNEVVGMYVSGFVFSKWLLPFTLITGLLYTIVLLTFEYHSTFLSMLLMACMGYFAYFISFGRKQYLQLRQIFQTEA